MVSSSSFYGQKETDAALVNSFHLNSDVDKSAISQHHTLGISATQASPGDHNHDGTDSRRIKLGDIEGSVELKDLVGASIPFTVAGGTLGTQPTFTGAPLFTGSYTKMGNLCHFQIDVDMDNIISFGTGQYYMTLPFLSEHNYLVSDGCLHDISASDQYSVMGHVVAGSNQLRLLSVASNGKHVPFTHNVPVTLAVADNFHVAGTYEIQQ
jgi:hypothetical protein